MSTTTFNFKNNAFIDYKATFEIQTGLKLDEQTIPIYLEYLKVIFANQQTQLAQSIWGAL